MDVTRATAESDLTHLAQQTFDTVNVTLDEMRDDVARMEAEGMVEPDVRAIRAAEAAEPDEDEAGLEEPSDAPTPERMTAEEAIAELRGKIDRIGPVNMMAIEQHAELETRHVFLTTQRQDLIDSIAQTNEAIKRSTRRRTRASAKRSRPSTTTSRSRSRRCSAAAAPASSCSTRPIRSRAASTSSPRRRASGCRA